MHSIELDHIIVDVPQGWSKACIGRRFVRVPFEGFPRISLGFATATGVLIGRMASLRGEVSWAHMLIRSNFRGIRWSRMLVMHRLGVVKNQCEGSSEITRWFDEFLKLGSRGRCLRRTTSAHVIDRRRDGSARYLIGVKEQAQ